MGVGTIDVFRQHDYSAPAVSPVHILSDPEEAEFLPGPLSVSLLV